MMVQSSSHQVVNIYFKYVCSYCVFTGDGELLLAEPPDVVSVMLKCHVMLQKEGGENVKFDEECGKPVDEGHAGLCE